MAKFIFLDQLSTEALTWLKGLRPVVDDADLSESVLRNKIGIFLRENKTDATVKEYLLELSVLSLSIAQSIIVWLPHIKNNSGAAIFKDEQEFTNLLLDKFAKTEMLKKAKTELELITNGFALIQRAETSQTTKSENHQLLEKAKLEASEEFTNVFAGNSTMRTQGYQAANTWIKSISSKPLSTFSLLWSKWLALFSDEITTAKRIINAKVDSLIDINSTDIINDNVAQLVVHAKNHTDILEALINRQNSRSFFSLDDYDEKYLTAHQWFDLLLVYKDDPIYREKICDILLKPRGLFSFSEKTSLAYTDLKKYFNAINNAGFRSLGLLNDIFNTKNLKQQAPEQVQQLLKERQLDRQKIQQLEERLGQQASQHNATPKRKKLFTNVTHGTPAGLVRQDRDDNNDGDDLDDNYEANGNGSNENNERIKSFVEEASEDGDEKLDVFTEEDLTKVHGGRYVKYPQEEASSKNQKFAEKHGEYIIFQTKSDHEQQSSVKNTANDQAALTNLFDALSPTKEAWTTGNGIRDAWRLHVNDLYKVKKDDGNTASSSASSVVNAPTREDFAAEITPKTEFTLKAKL